MRADESVREPRRILVRFRSDSARTAGLVSRSTRWFLLLLFTLLVASACGGGSSGVSLPSTGGTYTHPTHGYLVTVPSWFRLGAFSGTETDVSYFTTYVESDAKIDLRELTSGGEVEILVNDNADRRSLRDWLVAVNASVETGEAPGEAIPLAEFVDDSSTGKTGLKRTEISPAYKSVTYLFAKETIVYTFTGFFPHSPEQERLIQDFETMAKSFQP